MATKTPALSSRLIRLTNDDVITVPSNLLETFVGVTEGFEGGQHLVVHSEKTGLQIALTRCCNATATGGQYGATCRKCGHDVDGVTLGTVDDVFLIKPVQ